jgi:hypothetical protein
MGGSQAQQFGMDLNKIPRSHLTNKKEEKKKERKRKALQDFVFSVFLPMVYSTRKEGITKLFVL